MGGRKGGGEVVKVVRHVAMRSLLLGLLSAVMLLGLSLQGGGMHGEGAHRASGVFAVGAGTALAQGETPPPGPELPLDGPKGDQANDPNRTNRVIIGAIGVGLVVLVLVGRRVRKRVRRRPRSR